MTDCNILLEVLKTIFPLILHIQNVFLQNQSLKPINIYANKPLSVVVSTLHVNTCSSIFKSGYFFSIYKKITIITFMQKKQPINSCIFKFSIRSRIVGHLKHFFYSNNQFIESFVIFIIVACTLRPLIDLHSCKLGLINFSLPKANWKKNFIKISILI